MKRMMRNGNTLRRGVSLLLMMSLLIALLSVASVAAATSGAYGSCTVTTKNVVIRSTPAGSRTGYFAQPGTYPMIGPVVEVDGVDWYNIQTSATAGYVSGDYATASYGSAGMPSTDKIYTYIQADVLAYVGVATTSYDHTLAANQVTISKTTNPVLQLVTGSAYNVSDVDYIDIYYNNAVYHTLYSNNIANGVMTQDNLNDYISGVTWKQTITESRSEGAKGDYLTHAMQAALYVLDYYDDTVDGDYGAKTSEAVQDFKEDMIGDGYAWTANGVAGSAIFAPLFELAIDRLAYIRSTDGLGVSTGGTTTSTMIQTTIDNLRIRKTYSTSSTYVGMIPTAGTILTYTRTHLSGTVTWYYVQYDGTYGWVMGTYVTVYTVPTTDTDTTTTITNYGTATITKKLVAIRETPNGKRTGYHVNTGDECTLIGPVVAAGGYDWYHIRTESGRTGYVRGDCVEAEMGSAGMPSSAKQYVQFLYDSMQIRKGADPATATAAWQTVTKDSVLQLVTGSAYTVASVDYINVYYQNEVYHAYYTNDLVKGLMSQDNTNNYISTVLWARTLTADEVVGKSSDGGKLYTGDICVQAVQVALYQLGLYDDKMDGIYGDKTETAIKKFRKTMSSVTESPGIVGPTVSAELFAQAKAALAAKLTAAATTDTGDGTVPSAGTFGTVNTVKKGSWAEIDGGAVSLFPKGTVATVMSVTTKQVFRLYRWSGANHADCVPYDTTDTATLCSILGFTYNSSKPSSTQLQQIKAAGDDDYPTYTWPDFRGGFGSTAISGSKEKIPVWVNLNGTVYCASIYTIPHGFTGTSGFSLSKLNGQYFYDRNNMYGMLCVHFYGSTTHATGTVNTTHMNNINTAYNTAKTYSAFSGKVQ